MVTKGTRKSASNCAKIAVAGWALELERSVTRAASCADLFRGQFSAVFDDTIRADDGKKKGYVLKFNYVAMSEWFSLSGRDENKRKRGESRLQDRATISLQLLTFQQHVANVKRHKRAKNLESLSKATKR